MIRSLAVVAALSALAAGCASPAPPARGPIAGPRPSGPAIVRPVPTSSGPLIGQNAGSLLARFGRPALDVLEGPARKLQFAGERCTLDAYLYPREGRGEPIVTHVDARAPDGSDTDRDGCARMLDRR